MTREERLELLKQIEKDIYVCSIESTFLDDAKSCAIHSVIEELEREPCEDAISRQSVLDATVKKNSIWNSITNSKGENLEEIISQLSPVTPKLKTGHWISFGVQGEVDGQIVHVFTCSECGAISIFRLSSGNIVNGDLCPNCGCCMIEPTESETEQGLSYADQDTLMSAT